VALWREDNPRVFAATILAAAERLGVQPLAVEKDYWICEVLRTIVAAHGGDIVFKGGTSLEKLRLIERFSEDLDLLVVSDYGQSRNAVKRALKEILAAAASTVGGRCAGERSGGSPGTMWRQAYLELPLEHGGQSAGLADPKAVLIELGQSGGPRPSLSGAVQSLLSRQLAGNVDGEWDDLQPFAVTILHPGRTLLEKLLRVNNFVVDPGRRDSAHGLPRIGRQFYDIWALLGDAAVVELLADRVQAGEILASIFEVSELFTPDHPVPDGGFASSVAFDSDGEFAADLRREHDEAMRSLYYGSAAPTFDEVIDRVRSCRELLDLAGLG